MAEAIVPAGAPMPVMDVVAPPVEKEEKQEAPTSQADVDPVDALAAEDQQSQATASEHPSAEKAAETTKAKPKTTVPPKPKEAAGNGVGMAIIATVIIVFGLAILAVYAYMQTNK